MQRDPAHDELPQPAAACGASPHRRHTSLAAPAAGAADRTAPVTPRPAAHLASPVPGSRTRNRDEASYPPPPAEPPPLDLPLRSPALVRLGVQTLPAAPVTVPPGARATVAVAQVPVADPGVIYYRVDVLAARQP